MTVFDRTVQGVESSPQKFFIPVRVYFEDTDAGGVVYHATYLRFMERARSDWLRAIGFEHQRLANEFKVCFMVTGLSIKYRQPALLEDEVRVTARLASLGYARIAFVQTVERGAVVLTTATISVACLALGGMKPTAIPEEMREKMKGLL